MKARFVVVTTHMAPGNELVYGPYQSERAAEKVAAIMSEHHPSKPSRVAVLYSPMMARMDCRWLRDNAPNS